MCGWGHLEAVQFGNSGHSSGCWRLNSVSVSNVDKGSPFFRAGFSQDKRQNGVLFLVTIKISLFALVHALFSYKPLIINVGVGYVEERV